MTLLRSTALCLCLLAGSLAGLAGDWPQLLGPDRNGISREPGPIKPWGKKGPEVLWQVDAGDGYASPVVAGGKVVLFHRLGDEDTVACFDAARGNRLWRSAYRTNYEDPLGKGNGPRATPVVAGGKVYTLGAAGQLRCVDLKKGSKVWERDLAADYDPPKGFFGLGSTPLVEGELLLVNVGAKGAGIVAFHKDTGKPAWKTTDDEASYSSPIAATVAGVRHVFFFTRTGLVSLDPVNGKVRFHKRWRSRIHASVNAAMPVFLGGDHLFLSACYGTGAVLLKVRKDGVDEVWKSQTALSCHFSTPVAVGGYLFGFEGRQEEGAKLRCIEWKTGKVRWTEDAYGCGSVVAVAGQLLVLGEGGELALLEASGRKYVEQARATVLGQPCRAHLACADGRVYARDGKKLVCWKVK
jgi:outer membrane protein assembly factor BamB